MPEHIDRSAELIQVMNRLAQSVEHLATALDRTLAISVRNPAQPASPLSATIGDIIGAVFANPKTRRPPR